MFSPSLAGNALLGIVLGGVFAAVVGAVATGLLLAIVHAIIPQTLHSGTLTGEDIADLFLGPFIPLHSPVRDSLQLFLVAHGVAIGAQGSVFSDGSTGSLNFLAGKPLNVLLLIPAIVLTLGGYVAASTDLQNNPRSSLWRGAAIAVPYVVLLFLMASQVNGTIPPDDYITSSSSNTSVTATLNVDTVSLVVYGLLWGALFGLLGASIKLARGQWRHMISGYLQSNSVSRFGGMIAGALAAAGMGISLSLLVLFCLIAFLGFYSATLVSGPYNPVYSALYSVQSVVGFTHGAPLAILSLVQGPLVAVNLFFFSFGAPVGYSATCTGNPNIAGCNYNNNFVHYSISMFGGNPNPPPAFHPWIYALLLLPAISLFFGGRVSASLGRARGVGAGAVQGALVALPFVLLMMLLTIISTVSFSYTGMVNNSFDSSSGGSLTLSAGVGAFDLFLWALLSGAVFGALGGAYQASALKAGFGGLLSALALPFRLISRPWCHLLDRITRQPVGASRSSARGLLYGAFLLALLLAIATVVVGAVLIAYNQAFSFDFYQRSISLLSVLLIALPGLLLISACASALAHDPLQSQGPAPRGPF